MPSQIVVDKPATVHRDRIGSRIWRLSERDLNRLDVVPTWVMGLGGQGSMLVSGEEYK